MIVGDPRDMDHAGPDEYGAAYIFEKVGLDWCRRYTINPVATPDPYTDNNFARQVANDGGQRFIVTADFGVKIIDGNMLAVGAVSAYEQYPSGPRPGVAYVFGRDSGVWTERLRIVPADLTLSEFGIKTAVSGGIVAAREISTATATWTAAIWP